MFSFNVSGLRNKHAVFTHKATSNTCLQFLYTLSHTKAFDSVSRDGLWKIMAKFGCPPRFIVRQFHVGMQACVQTDGEYSEPFLVTNGVKPGCAMAPTLFSMMFSAMLTDAFQGCDAYQLPTRLSEIYCKLWRHL